jgi:hypothetical protein
VCACVRACVRACMCALTCVRACVCLCVRAAGKFPTWRQHRLAIGGGITHATSRANGAHARQCVKRLFHRVRMVIRRRRNSSSRGCLSACATSTWAQASSPKQPRRRKRWHKGWGKCRGSCDKKRHKRTQKARCADGAGVAALDSFVFIRRRSSHFAWKES